MQYRPPPGDGGSRGCEKGNLSRLTEDVAPSAKENLFPPLSRAEPAFERVKPRSSGLGSFNPSEALFLQEPFTDGLILELGPLLRAHYEEVAHYLDIPLDPDWTVYREMYRLGRFRVFTVRDQDKELIGYSGFFVYQNPHYRVLQAVNDVIFIRKDRRGNGRHFIAWCDERLREEGVRVVYHHVKAAHDWTPLLTRMGYEFQDKIMSRRLDL